MERREDITLTRYVLHYVIGLHNVTKRFITCVMKRGYEADLHNGYITAA